MVTELHIPIASQELVTPNEEAKSDCFDFTKTKVTPLKRNRPTRGQNVTPPSADHVSEPYQEQSGIDKSLACSQELGSVRPATRRISEAILFSIFLAHLRASLLDKDAMLRAERLSAMADSVCLLSIRSYHCHETGYHAKCLFDSCTLGRGLWAVGSRGRFSLHI